jgi:ribonuclease III
VAQTDAEFEFALERLVPYLEHRFNDPSLLLQALTHSSVSGHAGRRRPSNERLEFLGDRVLGLLVSQLLYETYLDEDEGALARRYSFLVSGEALAQVAEQIDLGECLNVSRSEEEAGGTRNPGLLADSCEAVIAALYLDGGLDAARRFVHRFWLPLMGAALRPPKDAKTELQEWAQARALALPHYREVSREGPPHAPRFLVEVRLHGLETVTASGPSKRTAEQAAAEGLLTKIKERDDS